MRDDDDHEMDEERRGNQRRPCQDDGAHSAIERGAARYEAADERGQGEGDRCAEDRVPEAGNRDRPISRTRHKQHRDRGAQQKKRRDAGVHSAVVGAG